MRNSTPDVKPRGHITYAVVCLAVRCWLWRRQRPCALVLMADLCYAAVTTITVPASPVSILGRRKLKTVPSVGVVLCASSSESIKQRIMWRSTAHRYSDQFETTTPFNIPGTASLKLGLLMSFAEIPVPKLAYSWYNEAVLIQPGVDF